jgi:hypothetical protein
MLNMKQATAAGGANSQEIEARLNHARQSLAEANTAKDFAAIGEYISPIIGDIDAACERLTDAIADEAASIDRGKANALRAERSTLRDLLSDAESLQEIISARHEDLQKSETDAQMLKLQEDARKIRDEATKLIVGLQKPLQQLVDLAEKTTAFGNDISSINNKLRAADRNELCVHGPLNTATTQGHQLTDLNDILFGAGARKIKAALLELERAAPLLNHQGSGK